MAESSLRICPRFTTYELSQIDLCLSRGMGRCRSDFVRVATLKYIERMVPKTETASSKGWDDSMEEVE